jgi:hypothetical protein
MTKFDLKNFTNPKPAIDSKDITPDWLNDASSKIKLGHSTALGMFDSIKNLIISEEHLNIKERRLVLAKIAKEIGVDRSYLTKRRTPEFCNLILELNNELDSIWSKIRPSKDKGNSKDYYQKELTKYKNLYNLERDKQYSEVITEMLKSELYSKSKRMSKMYSDLKVENLELHEKVSTLQSRLRSYIITKVD